MQVCWLPGPKDRPTFLEIIERLEPDLNIKFGDMSYFHSDARRETKENAAMAAAAANAISVDEYIAAGEQSDVHTPLTGSPCYSLEDLDLESDVGGGISRHSQDSLAASSHCSHRQSCDCVDIKEKSCRSPKRTPPVVGAVGGVQPPMEMCRDYIETNFPPSSNEGSGGSSRLHLNGMVNGHVPNAYLSQQGFTEC